MTVVKKKWNYHKMAVESMEVTSTDKKDDKEPEVEKKDEETIIIEGKWI